VERSWNQSKTTSVPEHGVVPVESKANVSVNRAFVVTVPQIPTPLKQMRPRVPETGSLSDKCSIRSASLDVNDRAIDQRRHHQVHSNITSTDQKSNETTQINDSSYAETETHHLRNGFPMNNRSDYLSSGNESSAMQAQSSVPKAATEAFPRSMGDPCFWL
jgi:hypothetical protein